MFEIGNALSRRWRNEATQILNHFLESDDVDVVRLTSELFHEAFDLYRSRSDKTWGLTDCLSFITMRRAGVTKALTFDRHVAQAGFVPLMRDDLEAAFD